MKITLDRDRIFTYRNMFILGLIISFLVSFLEVMRGRQLNFMIFQLSTLDFWSGVSPYGEQWFEHGLDYFLYAPPFSVLFAPFAYLPSWLGPIVWNMFNYSMYALSIFTLPRFDKQTKIKILLYTLPILAAGQLSFQYNIAIAYIYLFAFTFMESGRAHWAVLLIMISALTKVYGLFELSILLFYPKLWRNLSYAVGFGVIIVCLPLLKLPIDQLVPYYGQWIDALGAHKDTRVWETFFYIDLWQDVALHYMTYIQMFTLSALAVVLFICRKRWCEFTFRIQALGILMGWIILFSNAAEKHTYVIALLGYLMWYWSLPVRLKMDRIIYWLNFIVLVIIPIDIICPPFIMKYLFNTLDLNKWLFLITWLIMIYRTTTGRSETICQSQKLSI